MKQNKRKELTEDRIISAALQVVRRDGEAGLTMRMVAKEAKTGAGAIYRYFENKDDLLAAMLDRVALVLDHPPVMDDPVEELTGIFLSLRDVLRSEPWMLNILAPGNRASSHILPLFERALAALEKSGRDIDDSISIMECLLNYTYGDVLVYAAWQATGGLDAPRMTAEHVMAFERLCRALSRYPSGKNHYEINVRRILSDND